MAKIGILGKDSNETAGFLLSLCSKLIPSELDNPHKILKRDGMSIVCIDEKIDEFSENSLPKIWLIQDADVNAVYNKGDFLILNTDKRARSKGACTNILSYGFNSKASVTASSVADGAMQVCIQRGFKSMGQQSYEPMEFKTVCPADVNPLNVLGAVCACAVCDLLPHVI